MNVADVLKKERIELNLNVSDKNAALVKLVDLLYDSGAICDKQAFLNDVIERENVSTTGVGNGIAIPHGKSKNVKETTVAIGRVNTDLEWQSVDDKPVRFIVLLAVNEDDKTGVHVKLLSQMARKLASPEKCELLLNAASSDEVIKIFSE